MACWSTKVKEKSSLVQKSLIELVEKGNETFVEYINCIHKKNAFIRKNPKKNEMLQTLKHKNKPNAINRWSKK
jgi:uncharacterized membrane protein required for colicin V production